MALVLFFLHMEIKFSQYYLLKMLSFSLMHVFDNIVKEYIVAADTISTLFHWFPCVPL